MGYKDILLKFIRLIYKCGENEAKTLLQNQNKRVKMRLEINNFFSHLKIYTQKDLTGTADLVSIKKIDQIMRRDQPHAVVIDHMGKIEQSGENIYKETFTTSKYFQFIKEDLNLAMYVLIQIGKEHYDGNKSGYVKKNIQDVPGTAAAKGGGVVIEDADLQISFADHTRTTNCPEDLKFTLKWKAVKNRIFTGYVAVLRFWYYSPVSTQVADTKEELIKSFSEVNDEDDLYDPFLEE